MVDTKLPGTPLAEVVFASVQSFFGWAGNRLVLHGTKQSSPKFNGLYLLDNGNYLLQTVGQPDLIIVRDTVALYITLEAYRLNQAQQ